MNQKDLLRVHTLHTVKYSDGSTTPGYVSSEFLGDTKEGLGVLRAYTKNTGAQNALRYMPWVVSNS